MALVRFLKFCLKYLYIIVTVIALIILVSFFAYDNAYINIVTRDGMSARADCILNNNTEDTILYKLQPLFTTNYVYNVFDGEAEPFADYTARNFRYSITVGFAWVAPWTEECSVEVTERLLDLSLKYTGDGIEDKENVPKWIDGKYKVYLAKKNGVWKIDGVELIEPLEEIEKTEEQ